MICYTLQPFLFRIKAHVSIRSRMWQLLLLLYYNDFFYLFLDQLDLWTQSSSGCTCPNDVLDHSCACCVSNACLCGGTDQPRRCGQCGLEQYCDDSKSSQILSLLQ